MISRRTFVTTGALGLAAGCAHQPGPEHHAFHDVRARGALGDGKTDDTAVFQAALDACAGSGGTVFVPAGTYHLRPLLIGSRTTLRLDAGAVLQASPKLDDYPHAPQATSHESTRF